MNAAAADNIGEWAAAHSPIVVGLDGSQGSRSALDWAAAEAARAGADLRLVAVADENPLSPRVPMRLNHHRAQKAVDEMVATVKVVPTEQLSTEVLEGDAQAALLADVEGARLLVVGKRGLGVIPRLLVGSTSLALAGRSPVPVAVVPTDWDPHEHAGEPVVLGVDPYRSPDRLLHLAFRRADELGVPLVAVHGWEAPSGAGWSDTPVEEWETEAHAEFGRTIEPWRGRFPDVEVRPVISSHHPAMAVLDAAEQGAQLVVLGRHASSRFTGFVFGSVTRAVLHYSTVPVLVVPTDEA